MYKSMWLSTYHGVRTDVQYFNCIKKECFDKDVLMASTEKIKPYITSENVIGAAIMENSMNVLLKQSYHMIQKYHSMIQQSQKK